MTKLKKSIAWILAAVLILTVVSGAVLYLGGDQSGSVTSTTELKYDYIVDNSTSSTKYVSAGARNGDIKIIGSACYEYSEIILNSVLHQDFNTEPKTVSLKKLLYESDKDGYNVPQYVESYYYDNSKQWMIYTSHEFTITFTGEKIVRVANEMINPKYLIKHK